MLNFECNKAHTSKRDEEENSFMHLGSVESHPDFLGCRDSGKDIIFLSFIVSARTLHQVLHIINVMANLFLWAANAEKTLPQVSKFCNLFRVLNFH